MLFIPSNHIWAEKFKIPIHTSHKYPRTFKLLANYLYYLNSHTSTPFNIFLWCHFHYRPCTGKFSIVFAINIFCWLKFHNIQSIWINHTVMRHWTIAIQFNWNIHDRHTLSILTASQNNDCFFFLCVYVVWLNLNAFRFKSECSFSLSLNEVAEYVIRIQRNDGFWRKFVYRQSTKRAIFNLLDLSRYIH